MRWARDWGVRLMLLGLRWWMPLMLVVSDTIIFYLLVLSAASVAMARGEGIGARNTWAQLLLQFVKTQQLFTQKLHAGEEAGHIPSPLPPSPYSEEATGREWRDFSLAWNAIVRSLRRRDLLSDVECDELLFHSLTAPEHASFFGVPKYTTLPSMLSAPVFTGSRDKSLISPSYISYEPLPIILAQLRDLLAFLLVSVGSLERRDCPSFCELLSELASHARTRVQSKADGRALLRKLTVRLDAFLRGCAEVAEGEGEGGEGVLRLHATLNHALDELSSLLAPSRDTSDPELDPDSSSPSLRSPHRPEPTSPHPRGVEPTTRSRSAGLPRVGSRGVRRSDLRKEESESLLNRPTERPAAPPPLPIPPPSPLAAVNLPSETSPPLAAVGALRQLRSILQLKSELTPPSHLTSIVRTLRKPATREVLSVLLRSFSTLNPGGEPQSDEAKRQLISFCASLRHNSLGRAPPLRRSIGHGSSHSGRGGTSGQ